MDPYERLRSSIVSRFSFRELIPWLILITLVAILLAIVANETFTSDKSDLSECVLSDWSPYKGCENNDCTGIGIRSRTVLKASDRCTNQALYQTQSCKEIQNCLLPDCQYSNWSPWSDCPNLCFNNDLDCNTIPNQLRYRNVIRPALPGGVPCDWTSLVQERACVVQDECPPNRDCVANPPNPILDCNECPDRGCTLTNQPYWTMCTASILQSQSGTGAKCARDQILYSQTCNLPDCREQCIGNDFGYFQRCTAPCGDGFYVSSTVNECPDITVGSCSNGSCSLGTFVKTTLTSCTTAGTTFCSATDILSFTQCLAKAVSDPDVDILFSVSTGAYLGSSSTMTCNTSGTDSVFQWNKTSSACIPPTWDMVNAVCLFLCDASNPNYYSLERGISFPFSNGSVSCPINPYVLSISNVCPIDGQALQGRLFGSAMFPNTSTTYRSVTDPYSNESFTLLCPMSKDCKYQSWSDAPIWNICQNPCAEGGGERSRYRAILSPASFLGIPCDPLETLETVPCNLATVMTSATEMWCSFSTNSLTYFSTTSEFICHEKCSETRADNLDACNSMFNIYRSHSEDEREIFLASYNPPFFLDTGDINSFVQEFKKSPFGDPTAAVAEYNELVKYFNQGGQSCQQGWYNRDMGTFFKTMIGASVQQEGCGGSINQQGLYPDLGGTLSEYVWISSKKSLAYKKEAAPPMDILIQPFFSATTDPSPLNSNYTFSNQSFSDSFGCALEAHRTDLLLMASSCTSLSGKPISQVRVTNTMLLDVPCDEARDCSLTDWVNVTSCGPCRPPFSYVQTRTIVARATEGGDPCDNFALIQTVPCPSNLPDCTTGTSYSLCLADQFPQKAGTSANACDLMSLTYPFLEAWNQTFVYQWAVIQQKTASNLFTYLKSMTTGVFMPQDLAIALNTQPLTGQGTAPLCIIGVNSNTRAASGNIYEFSISSAGSALGWKLSSCVPDPFVTTTVLNRVDDSYLSITKRYFDVNNNQWKCPSACGYTSETCILSPPGSCSCGLFSQTAETGFRVWEVDGDLYCKTTSTVAAIYRVPCPNPYVNCGSTSDCPIGCDNSPCSSASGFGICSLTNVPSVSILPFYQCVCSNGSLQKDCSVDCPYGFNGLVCSGHGSCTTNGVCQCDTGYSGFACDQLGTAMLGLMEGMLLNARLSYTVLTDSSLQVGTVTVKNLLPCENQNNPACNQVQFIGPQALAYELPILSLQNQASAVRNANMCINSGDGLSSDIWVPSYMTMMSIGSLSCASFTGGGIINENFNVTCRFVSNTNVPSYLVGKQFNVRCMNTGNTVGNYTYFRPAQFDSNNKMIFEVLGYGQKTLDQVCNS